MIKIDDVLKQDHISNSSKAFLLLLKAIIEEVGVQDALGRIEALTTCYRRSFKKDEVMFDLFFIFEENEVIIIKRYEQSIMDIEVYCKMLRW